MYEDSVAVVRAWQDAANVRDNVRDKEQLLALFDPEIEIVGPRGSGYGHPLLAAWLARAGLDLEARRTFARGDAVVLAQHGVWHSLDTGEPRGEADLAASFWGAGGRVTRFSRHDALADALRQAGLTEAGEGADRAGR